MKPPKSRIVILPLGYAILAATVIALTALLLIVNP
jgi:hypothetical protein